MTLRDKVTQQYQSYTPSGDFNSSRRILEVLCQHTNMRYGMIRKKDDSQWGNWCVYDSTLDCMIMINNDTYVKIYQEIRMGFKPIYIDNIDQCAKDQWSTVLQEFGLKSYISYPIISKQGTMLGHLSFMHIAPVHFDQNKLETLLPVCSDLIAIDFNTLTEVQTTKTTLQQELNYSKNRDLILSSLAHDLNNPVSTIKLLSQYLEVQLQDEKQKGLIKKITEASIRVKEMIDDILDFSAIRLGNGLVSTYGLVNINSLIKQVLSEFEFQAHDIMLLPISVPIEIFCDKNKMGRAFANLIGNAIKHGKLGEEIKISAFLQKDNFVFSVTNEISQLLSLNLSELFKPFVRSTDSRGLGLGLYITKKIAESHDGKLAVTSKGNKITFKLIIPIK